MSTPQNTPTLLPDPLDLSLAVKDIIARSGRLSSCLLEKQFNGNALELKDDLGINRTFLAMLARLVNDPWHLFRRQIDLWQSGVELWRVSLEHWWSNQPMPAITPEKGDHRFRDDAWNNYLAFDLIKQSYLLSARWLRETVTGVQGLDAHTARKVDFYTRQFIDALAPTNFILTNPEVLRETVNSNGQNLLRGLRNLLTDLERGNGNLNVRMTDLEAFRLGENIAATPGKVVFQNHMFQLLQYTPTTATVRRRPLLIVPPWINKFYILDLRAKNSFIKWAVDQGHTVFVISWINPTAEYADTSFDDYLRDGTLMAVDAVVQATGEDRINTVGYCLGGTLLASTLAYLAQVQDERIASATFFTTLLDFSKPGELGVFLDEEQVSNLEKRMNERGYLDGSEMATTFNMLRANDLIWSFFINNYLLGKDPFPFDLLYWNSDSTRMPAQMHSFYLRNMYLENRLVQPGSLTLCGKPLDLGKIKTPAYFLSTIEDHIAPWQSTYIGARLLQGPVRFVLGGSGHIAGVINPPAANKYGYWTNEQLPAASADWLNNAQRHDGSWWNDWHAWTGAQNDEQVPARQPGDGALKVIEDAPGTYVKYRLVAS